MEAKGMEILYAAIFFVAATGYILVLGKTKK
jgi:hypothetical protein